MDTPIKLTKDILLELAEVEDMASLSAEAMRDFFREEIPKLPHLPSSKVVHDPRNQLPIFYSPGRQNRPFIAKEDRSCPICEGNLTGIIDLCHLSGEEYAFINKNLYPISVPQGIAHEKNNNWGLHFLLWPSNIHERRFENMEINIAHKVLSRVILLEKILLNSSLLDKGYFAFIRNEGQSVGGSVYHDHFQMLYSNQEPLSFREDRNFYEKHGVGPTQILHEEISTELIVLSQGEWQLVVPPYIKRPYELMIYTPNRSNVHLNSLSETSVRDLTFLLQKSFQLQTSLFKHLGKDKAYNLICHNSGYGSIYFELFPMVQPLGGFERLGLYLSQGDPIEGAELYRQLLFS
ncbi:hypothetical protein [Spirochaeta cellobiosiphila]|uniref:hypothetical protein n=1 Tax=Spirochaeta cellobiosiphila TaxID=504483 RepID=UPI0003F9C018|nr:hypothetical protein [Spirochaeta cellobiosiphila]